MNSGHIGEDNIKTELHSCGGSLWTGLKSLSCGTTEGVWTQIRNSQISNRNLHHRIHHHHVQGLPCHLHVPIVLKSGSLNLPEPSGTLICLLFLYVQVVLTKLFRFSAFQLRPGPSMFSYFSYYHLCIFTIYFNKSLYSFLFKSWKRFVWQPHCC